MEAIEQNIRTALNNIIYKGKKIDSDQVVKSLELRNNSAIINLHNLQAFKEDEQNDIATLIGTALKKIDGIDTVNARVEQATQPQQQKPPQQTKKYLLNYKNVIPVMSGKGGVGKSTLTLNLALALQSFGKKVSLFDADIYGPSMPIMMGTRGIRPKIVGETFRPLKKFDISFMSIGSVISESNAVAWRGPMTHQAVEQLLRDTVWPGGDYMLIDMPPGTGDVQLSVSQFLNLKGAVIVCTPQDVALLDARRAVAICQKMEIPLLGLVENMSGYVCPHCDKESQIFGQGGAKKDSESFQIPFLGAVPIQLDIREGGDLGKPITFKNKSSTSAQHFISIAQKLEEILAKEI